MPPAENRKSNIGETARTGPGEGQKREQPGQRDDDPGKPGQRDDERDQRAQRDDDDDDRTFAEEGLSTRDLAARIRDLENTLAATRAGLPLTLVPEHGAGPGTDIRESWSQYEQELAIRGEDLP
jgi:TATA-binding protein-associated factor Taf7